MLLDVFDEVLGRVLDWNWRSALEVAAAIGGASGATLFLLDPETAHLRPVASTEGETVQCPIAWCDRAIPRDRQWQSLLDHLGADHGAGGWHVPIGAGDELLGVLRLDRAAAEPNDRAAKRLAEWADSVHRLLKSGAGGV